MAEARVKTEAELLKQFFEDTGTLPQALATSRSRRVGRGYSIEPGEEQVHPVTGRTLFQEKGPLSFVSQKEPVSLTEFEEAALCWVACGPNGVIYWDIAVHGAAHEGIYFTGKTTPTPGNSMIHDLLVISDRGSYIYQPTLERSKKIEIEGEEDYGKVMKWWREGSKKLMDTRPDIDWSIRVPGAPNAFLFGPYQYNINKPGSAWFIPIADYGHLYLTFFFNLFDWWHYYPVDDRTGEPAGVKEWVKEGYLEIPWPITSMEQFFFQVEVYPQGAMVQNIRLAAESMGLGNWVFCGYSDDVLMGAFPDVTKGLGAEFEVNEKAMIAPGQLCTRGWPGIKESTYVPSPRYPNGRAMAEDFHKMRYGKGGLWSKEDSWMLRNGGRSFKPEVAKAIIDHPRMQYAEWAYEATIAYVDYCVEKYGRCPVTFNPMQCNFGITVHHVDEEFYDRFYSDPGLTPRIREHFQRWH